MSQEDSSTRDPWEDDLGPLLTDEEVEVLQREVKKQADQLTALALMWLWANPEDRDWRKRWDDGGNR